MKKKSNPTVTTFKTIIEQKNGWYSLRIVNEWNGEELEKTIPGSKTWNQVQSEIQGMKKKLFEAEPVNFRSVMKSLLFFKLTFPKFMKKFYFIVNDEGTIQVFKREKVERKKIKNVLSDGGDSLRASVLLFDPIMEIEIIPELIQTDHMFNGCYYQNKYYLIMLNHSGMDQETGFMVDLEFPPVGSIREVIFQIIKEYQNDYLEHLDEMELSRELLKN